MGSRIAIFHPEGNFPNNPHLAGVLELLLERGHEVHLYCQPHPSQRHAQNHPKLHVVPLPPPPGRRNVPGSVLFSPRSSREAIVRTALHGLPRFSLALGVDLGVVDAAHVARVQGIPHGLLSYELLFESEVGRDFKREEVDACRDVVFALCQDDERAGHLARENAISRERILTMPVAGRGARGGNRTFALHDALGLTRDTKIAVYIGSTEARWTGSDVLLADVGKWPADWTLVLHHRFDSRSMERLLSGLSGPARSKVFISPFPSLAAHELHHLLHACDLGLCFYTPTYDAPLLGRNLEHIGMASGKFTTYLQHGLPVLVNDQGEMGRHVRRENLGWRILDIGETPDALAILDRATLESRRKYCLDFFSKRCDLDATGRPLLTAIEASCGTGRVEGAPPEDSEADFSECMIQARMSMAHGDMANVQELLAQALALGRDADDVEEVYLTALDLQKRGHAKQAMSVFRRLHDNPRASGDLAAWALFKRGEACLERGEEAAARALFARALERNPGHVKAAIFLTPPDEPLRVRIGPGWEDRGEVPQGILVPMDLMDEGQWSYYFGRRRPDRVELRLSGATEERDLPYLARLLGAYLAPGGGAVVRLSKEGGPLEPSGVVAAFEKQGLRARWLAGTRLAVSAASLPEPGRA